ncbi:MAG: serine protease [Candidatus Kapabacteria bacterium]|nr:serine protease [Candidatus Kapabacteria bacterium]
MTSTQSAPLPIAIRLHAEPAVSTEGIGIAMIDSDFIAHPDLVQPVNRIARYVDAVEQTESATAPLTAAARHWHGTMTACTAAGNGYRSRGLYTSLAPDAKLILIRTMNEAGRVPTSCITWALEWIRDNAATYGIRVVNISVYADEIDQTLDHPVNAAVEELVHQGIVVVTAAGNNPLAPIRPPAAAPGAITVGGLDDRNTMTDRDNHLYPSTFGTTALGIQKPELIAPAIWLAGPLMPESPQQRMASALFAMDALDDDLLVELAPRLVISAGLSTTAWDVSTLPHLRQLIADTIRSEQLVSPFYKLVDGTSFAAPIVSSIVAQLLAHDESLTPEHVKTILMETARPLPEVDPERQGAGMVDQPGAVARVLRSRSFAG